MECVNAAVTMFRAELTCAVKIERAEVAKAARRQQERGEAFVTWMEMWYDDYAEQLSARTRSSVTCWELVTKRSTGDWISAWCEESCCQLLAASDGESTGFVGRVQAVLDGWEERIEQATPEGITDVS